MAAAIVAAHPPTTQGNDILIKPPVALPPGTYSKFDHRVLPGNQAVQQYLTDEDKVAVAKVCKTWRSNGTINAEKTRALTELRRKQEVDKLFKPIRFTENFTKTLRDSGYNLKRLPILQLPALAVGARRHDYIDNIDPRSMTSPVMIFRDELGRAGFALRVRSKVTGTEYALSIHQRDPNRNFYVMTDNKSDRNASSFFPAYHNGRGHVGDIMSCRHADCRNHGYTMNPALFKRIIENKDPVFELVGQLPAKNGTPPSSYGLNTVIKGVATVALAAAAAYFSSLIYS